MTTPFERLLIKELVNRPNFGVNNDYVPRRGHNDHKQNSGLTHVPRRGRSPLYKNYSVNRINVPRSGRSPFHKNYFVNRENVPRSGRSPIRKNYSLNHSDRHKVPQSNNRNSKIFSRIDYISHRDRRSPIPEDISSDDETNKKNSNKNHPKIKAPEKKRLRCSNCSCWGHLADDCKKPFYYRRGR